MSQELAVLDVMRESGNYYIYFKSALCEEYFKKLSGEQYARSGPVIGTCSDPRTMQNIYRYYRLSSLPSTPYSLQHGWDVVNQYGWMRGQGVDKGLKIRSRVPILSTMADKLAERIEQNLVYINDTFDSTPEKNKVRRYLFVDEESAK